MTFGISKLRLRNLMAILTRRTILIGFKPLRGSLNSKITMLRRPSSWSFLSWKCMLHYGMNIWRRVQLEKPKPKSRLSPSSRSTWIRDFYPLLTNRNCTLRSPLSTKRIWRYNTLGSLNNSKWGLAQMKHPSTRLLGSLRGYPLALLARWNYNLTCPLMMCVT